MPLGNHYNRLVRSQVEIPRECSVRWEAVLHMRLAEVLSKIVA